MALEPQIARARFHELIWPLRAVVLRMARLLCRNDSEADDLAQETLMKAFAGLESFRPGTDVRAWLMRILRNARIDRVRSGARDARNVSLESIELDPAGPTENEQLGDDPRRILNAFSDQQIIDALRNLPEEIRFTLLLVDVQQMDQADAAAILDVPVGTIKSRAHRGRAMLRQALTPVARDMGWVRSEKREDMKT